MYTELMLKLIRDGDVVGKDYPVWFKAQSEEFMPSTILTPGRRRWNVGVLDRDVHVDHKDQKYVIPKGEWVIYRNNTAVLTSPSGDILHMVTKQSISISFQYNEETSEVKNMKLHHGNILVLPFKPLEMSIGNIILPQTSPSGGIAALYYVIKTFPGSDVKEHTIVSATKAEDMIFPTYPVAILPEAAVYTQHEITPDILQMLREEYSPEDLLDEDLFVHFIENAGFSEKVVQFLKWSYNLNKED